MNAEAKFNIGDCVWAAALGTREVHNVCPVCCGKLKVRVILGDDTEIETPCNYCGKGYSGPTGRDPYYTYVRFAEPAKALIKRIELDRDQVRYFTDKSYIHDAEDVFATREEAMARCAVRVADADAEDAKRRERLKEMAHKSYAWHVGYHRREAKRAREQASYHDARAIVCDQKKRTEVKP